MASLFKGFDLLALPGVPSTAMAIDVREVWVGEKDIVVRPRYSVTPRLEPHRFASDQPASLPACQPASLPACQPASLPACQVRGMRVGLQMTGVFRRRWSSVAGNGQALTGVMLLV
ncbi:hypothetical protein [Pseudomonas fragi]|uniref:hypothetical protein n=1 Tax=Pseudomonas fragi TaxID=296 RepID=UPI002953DE18|nr:hypothetical protein [Pseudomonas fragi]WOL26207.1 hypothetical protein Q1A94_14630 [Pseudomonas fragi]